MASSDDAARVYLGNDLMDPARRAIAAYDAELANELSTDTALVRFLVRKGTAWLRERLTHRPPLVGKVLSLEQALDLARAGVPHYVLISRLEREDAEAFRRQVTS